MQGNKEVDLYQCKVILTVIRIINKKSKCGNIYKWRQYVGKGDNGE
jgi:hypothetical protein